MSETTTKRPLPPPLEFVLPDCSVCGESTEYDDGFCCSNCDASWPKDGAPEGDWNEPNAEQCTSVLAPWRTSQKYRHLADQEYRCYLDSEHTVHHNPEWHDGWTDDSPHARRLTTATGTP